MTTWRKEINELLSAYGESWNDIESITIADEQLDKEFDDGYGGTNGAPFTVWTKQRVYFPAMYDGAEWVASVSRNPDGKSTEHIGG